MFRTCVYSWKLPHEFRQRCLILKHKINKLESILELDALTFKKKSTTNYSVRILGVY